MLFRLEEWPAHHMEVLYFRDVTNAPELRQMAARAEIQCALLNARLVLDVFQLQVAFHVAVTRSQTASLVTKSVHTELMRHLGADKNIGQALQRVGPPDQADPCGLVVVAIDQDAAALAHIRRVVAGQEQLEDVPGAVRSGADPQLVKRLYQIPHADGLAADQFVNKLLTHCAAAATL